MTGEIEKKIFIRSMWSTAAMDEATLSSKRFPFLKKKKTLLTVQVRFKNWYIYNIYIKTT